MRRIFIGFSNPKQLFRYYFIRKKSPLSWLFWGNILGRESSWQGSSQISIVSVDEPDALLSFNLGRPGENQIEIDILDANGKVVDRVNIHLSYRSMQRVKAGFNEASRKIRKLIREENRKPTVLDNSNNSNKETS